MKHIWLELKIGFLIIVGVALVLATGYLAYTSISSIVENIYRESKPDVKLSLIQSLATSLEKAENGIRLYAYSKDNKDLEPYAYLVTNADDQINRLRAEGADNSQFLAKIDTIADLVEKKVLVWNEMLPLYNRKQAEQYLDTISKELENKIEKDSLRKNRNIFKKIFKKSEKVEIDEKKIVQNIEQLREEDKQLAIQIRAKEVQLARASSKLTMQLYALIKKIEEEEIRLQQERAKVADEMATETYRWIGWFALSATLALLVVIFVISRYIKKSALYQEALIKAKNEAENLAKAKEMFVANVSHEVRTPLNVISGFITQLLGKKHDKDTQQSLDIIKSSSDHLVHIINDILDFSKLESGKMNLEPVHFNVKSLLTTVELLFHSQAKEKSIDFKILQGENLPEVLFGDPVRLRQVLINLIGNALKFTSKGSVICEIDFTNNKSGTGDLTVKVSDSGIGIPRDKLDSIFNDFSQIEGTTSKFGGTGLGLSIVKKIVDLHHGEIKVESRHSAGTTFLLSLSYKTGNAEKIAVSTKTGITVDEKVKSLKVLIVDDEVYNRKLIVNILKKWEIDYKEAENGHIAVERFKEGTFDFILMDKRMPEMDGFSAAAKIRELEKEAGVKTNIVLITAESITKDQFEALQKRGFNSWLPKPFVEMDLLKILSATVAYKPDGKSIEVVATSKKQKIEQTLLDLSNFERISGGDKPFIKEMLEKYISSFEEGYKAMIDFIEVKNYNKAADAAHKLVSPSRHLSAAGLVKILKEIEIDGPKMQNQENLLKKAKEAKTKFDLIKKEILLYLQNE
ncbi:MAG: response regulator [Bacteroidales bacterium]|nr:response regulator [Bacteroidales bacterium]